MLNKKQGWKGKNRSNVRNSRFDSDVSSIFGAGVLTFIFKKKKQKNIDFILFDQL